jgi:hypothetical protein
VIRASALHGVEQLLKRVAKGQKSSSLDSTMLVEKIIFPFTLSKLKHKQRLNEKSSTYIHLMNALACHYPTQYPDLQSILQPQNFFLLVGDVRLEKRIEAIALLVEKQSKLSVKTFRAVIYPILLNIVSFSTTEEHQLVVDVGKYFELMASSLGWHGYYKMILDLFFALQAKDANSKRIVKLMNSLLSCLSTFLQSAEGLFFLTSLSRFQGPNKIKSSTSSKPRSYPSFTKN